jgi:8-oxo-dGTP pyrophosphatase MutT (NUDIX family)
MLRAAEEILGAPHELSMTYEILPEELALIHRTQRHGRRHDVTTFILADGQLAVIAKPSYPPGVYRVPGGGLEPGEALIAGAAREALEETGLPYTVQQYLLRIEALFTCGPERQEWTTHVVAGTAPYQPPSPLDTREIREARWCTPGELIGHIAAAMLATGRPLFTYRVALHTAALERLAW